MEDRRIRKTKESIKNGYLKLMKEQPFKDITVNQIAEAADINRGTFYLHYLDKFDLRDKLEEDVLKQLDECLVGHRMKYLTDDPEEYSVAFINQILQVIHENKEYFSVMLIHQEEGLPQKFSSVIKNHIKRNIELPTHLDGVPIEFYFAFIINAQTGIIKQWVKDDMRESKENIAKYAFTLAYKGPLKLMQNYIREHL